MKSSPYRAGPWPGLTPAGALLVLACAVFLGIGQVLIGPPQRPLPDLPVMAATAFLPLAIAARILRTPGAATAACGAYLLPASLLALLIPSVPMPPLLLVGAITFDVALWLDASDLSALLELWPRRRRPRRSSRRQAPSRGRAILAGALLGASLCAVEPAFRMFLGGDPALWGGPQAVLAVPISALVCGALATLLSARGTAT